MKVALNVYPLKSAHKDRGIGYYTKNLLEQLKKDNSIEVVEFTSLSEVKKADVTHYPWFDLFFHTLPIKRRFPTVVTIHDVMPLIFPGHYPTGFKGEINLLLQKIALGSCKHIITDSKTSKADIVKYLKLQEEQITAIHLAVVDEYFTVLRSDTKLIYIKRRYRLPDKFLLYVGDANWVKNLPFLIEGFHQLIQESEFEDIKLVLIGGVFLKDVENIDHPELESLKLVNKLIKQYGLETRIIRPGQIKEDELVAFYNLATIYVQPSLYEGFGLPILQAFACGAPVISSDRGSLPEIGGKATVYFDPTNIKQFISVAQEILENKSLQDKLSKLGLEQAKRFSWKKVAEETKSVYLKVLNNE